MAKKLPTAKRGRSPKRYQERGLLTLTGRTDLERDAPRKATPELEARTVAQATYISSIENFTCTFATGPAGTGKTYIAAAMAAKGLLSGEFDKIIITRPALEAGEKLGFLPGDLSEKYEPYLAPFRIELEKFLGKGAVEMYLKNGRIEPIPLAFMRGRNAENAFVILDEAQNTTPSQMKLLLTRICEGSKLVIDGDTKQCDLPHGQKSGLEDALTKLHGMRGVAHVNFTLDDVVRSGFVQDVIERYEV